MKHGRYYNYEELDMYYSMQLNSEESQYNLGCIFIDPKQGNNKYLQIYKN